MIENNKQKTILYIGFYSLPDRDAAANRVMNNAKALSEAGKKVIFIDEQLKYPYKSFPESKHQINGFDVWSLKRPSDAKTYMRKMITIDKIMFVIKQYKKIDAVVAYNYPSIALFRLNRFCKKKNIRLIADCTEWYSGQEYRFPMNMLCAMDSWFRMRVVQKKLDGIICISSFLCEYYKKCNVVFIPPLVDSFSNKWNQGKYEYDDSKVNLVYAGNPGKSKELLIPVLEGVTKSINKDKLQLRIVGINEKQFLDLYPEASELIKIAKSNVEFLGRRPHNDTVKIISSSDYMVFLRPRNRVSEAGFSTKFVETITCRTALISNNTGDIKKFTEKTGHGFVIDKVEQFQSVLDMDIVSLKKNGEGLGESVSRMFDYREYKNIMNTWFGGLF